jgi:autotransporter-associated beta strand protein
MSGHIGDYMTDGGPQFVVKSGVGSLVLSGDNTYAGQTFVNEGTLVIAKNDSLGTGGLSATTKTTVASGATLALQNGISSGEHLHIFGDGVGGLGAIRNLSGTNTLTTTGHALRSNVTLGADAGQLIISGGLYEEGGTYGITKVGAGTIVLSGANTYTGTTTVSAGTLVIAGTTVGSNFTNNATLAFVASGGDISLAGGTLTGTGTVIKTGSQTLMIGADGSTQRISLSAGALIDVQQGVLRNEYGAGDWSANLGSLNIAAGANVSMWDSAGGITVDRLTGDGVLSAGYNGSRTLTVGAANGSGTFAGVLTNQAIETTAGVMSLLKVGTGTQTLTGANTYTGTTTVSAGTLVVNGSLGTGTVNVASGATLGGSGTLGGDLVVSGSHKPGNSPGTQTVSGNATYNVGSSITWELGANSESNATSVVFDQILVGGDLTFAGATTLYLSFAPTTYLSTVDWSDAFWQTDRSWMLIGVEGSTLGISNLTISIENWVDGQSDPFNSHLPVGSFSVTLVDSNVYLNYTVAIPEPSTYGLALGGLALALVAARRRKEGTKV